MITQHPDHPGRIPAHDAVGGHIPGDHRTSSDHGVYIFTAVPLSSFSKMSIMPSRKVTIVF